MKKLLSICFLSILLALMNVPVHAQTTQSCCFWLENLQPQTLHDISNVPGGGAAHLPGTGGDVVLNNTMNPVLHGIDPVTHQCQQTDYYRLRFSNTCNLPDTTKVSIEWKLYRDGQLVNGNLSDYADFRIYTRYGRLHNSTDPMTAGQTFCSTLGWIGGRVSGLGTCLYNTSTDLYPNYPNYNDVYCAGGYPGATEVEPLPLDFANVSSEAWGYTYFDNEMGLDYFNLPFFEATDHVIVICWKQVGNYSLVVGIRQRVGGTDWGSLYWDEEQQHAIGGHQSCCGALLAQDSIHYLVETNFKKAVCDGETWDFGSPIATYSVENPYLVIFGDSVCDHFRVDSLVHLDFYTRINPDIIADDFEICVGLPLTAAEVLTHTPAVHTDAPGIIDYAIWWSQDGTNWDTIAPSYAAVEVGTYTWYVKQINHYDAVTPDDFYCEGAVDTLTITVLPLYPPVIDPLVYNFCYNEMPAVFPILSEYDEREECATGIVWQYGTTNLDTIADGESYPVAMTDYFTSNVNKTITFNVFTTNVYANSDPTVVTIVLHASPELVGDNSLVHDTICPRGESLLKTQFTDANIAQTNSTIAYYWTLNGTAINENTATITGYAPNACTGDNTYVVTAVATSDAGCTDTLIRTFILTAQDTNAIVVAPKPTTLTNITVSGCDTTAAAFVDGRRTLADLQNLLNIDDHCSNLALVHYTASVTPGLCETYVTRTYILEDECGNVSNPYVENWTIKNDYKPVVVGNVFNVAPVPVQNCQFQVPAYEVLLAAFTESHTVAFECTGTETQSIAFYLDANATISAPGHLIFEESDTAYVYAIVTDNCGNNSLNTMVFMLQRPPRMVIDGGVLAVPADICLHDTVFLSFDTSFVHNATPLIDGNGESFYQLEWTAQPNDGSIIYHTSATAYGVPATPNTDYVYTIHVTDYYGCVDSISAEPVHVHGLPTVAIEEIILNGSTFPLCPNYGNLTIHSITEPGNGGEIVRHIWSGESVNLPLEPNMDTTFVAILPDSCNKTYTAYLTVLNNDGCKASTSYSFDVVDSIAPVVGNVVSEVILDPGANCMMTVPNLLPYFNNENVTDNCYGFGNLTITQSVAAGSLIAVATPVTMTITDRCGNSTTHVIVLRSSAPLTVTITADEPEICQGETVNLTTTVENAIVPVIYTWSTASHDAGITVQPTEAAHTYTVTVQDNIGCSAAASIDILVHHTPVAEDVTLIQTANTYCENEDGIYDGTVSIAAIHPDIVAWRMTGETTWQNLDYVYTGLQEGTYWFDLLTSYDCESAHIASVVVARDTNVIVPITTTTPNAWCVPPYDGSITITNPQLGYTYEIINLPNSDVLYEGGDLIYDNLIYGHYSIHVTTDKYCTYVKEDIIVDSTRVYPIVAISTTPKTRCDEPDGTITVTNAMPGYTYTLNGTTIVGAPAVFTGLNNGTYALFATTDFGCQKTFVVTVNSTTEDPIHPVAVFTPNSVCDEAITPNGSVAINAPIAGYTYTMNGETVVSDGTPIVFDELGINGETAYYTLTIVSEIGCTSVFTDSIKFVPFEPAFNNEITLTPNVNCEGTTPNGAINIAAETGYTYYTYTLAGTTPMLLAATYNLPAGNYRVVKVHDATGCQVDTVVEIKFVKAPYNWAVTLTPDQNCDIEEGNGTITVTSATDNYIFLLANDAMELVGQNTNGVFVALNSGDYYLAATNTNTTCVYDTVITIEENFVYPNITVTSSANHNCKEEKDGIIVVTNTGNAVLPITYNLYAADELLATNTTGVFEGVNSGDYIVEAISSMNCSDIDEITVIDSAFLPALVHYSTPNTMCAPTFEKPGNGTIVVTAPMDTNYIYYFENNNEPNVLDTVGYFTPDSYVMYWLQDDLYTIHVYDPLTGCSLEDTAYVPYDTVHITFDPEVIDNVNCEGPYTGIIILHATSENPDADFVYSIDGINYGSNNMFQQLAAGTYTIYVKDLDLGCSYEAANIIVEDSTEFKPIIEIEGNTVYCLNSEGQLIASATSTLPGDTVFHYSWYSVCTGTVDGPVLDLYTGHTGICTYYITVVSELTGCTSIDSINVEVEPNPTITFLVNQEPYYEDEVNVCHNDFPINLGVVPDGLVSFLWSNQVTESNFDVTLPNGNYCFYKVTVTDEYGCQNVDSIGVFSMPTYKLDLMDSICINEMDYQFYAFNELDSAYTDTIVGMPDDFLSFNAQHFTWVDSLQSIYGCDSVVYHHVTLQTIPEVTPVDSIVTEYCHGESLTNFTFDIVDNNSPVTESGWRIYNNDTQAWEELDVTAPVTYAMNGAMVMPYAINSCGESTTEPLTLTVDSLPKVEDLELNCDNVIPTPGQEGLIPAYQVVTYTFAGNYTYSEYLHADDVDGNISYTVAQNGGTAAPRFNDPEARFYYGNNHTLNGNSITILLDEGVLVDHIELNAVSSYTPLLGYKVDGGAQQTVTATNGVYTITNFQATSSIEIQNINYENLQLWLTSFAVGYTFAMPSEDCAAEFCEGEDCADVFAVPEYECNHHEDECEGTWVYSANENGPWTPIANNILTYAMNGGYVAYQVTNSCGSSVSTPVQITVDTLPVATIEPVTICKGDTLNTTANSLNLTWIAGNTTTAAPLTMEIMPTNVPTATGSIYVALTNKCGSNNTNTVTVTVNDVPSMTDFAQPGPCIDYFELTIPTVTWNGSEGTTDLQYYDADEDEWVSTTVAALANVNMNGTLVRYIATNDCGSTADSLTLAVIATPEITLNAVPTLICQYESDTLSFTANWTPSADQIIYQMSTDQQTWTNIDTTNTQLLVPMNTAGTFYFRISVINNNCAPDGLLSNVVTVTVEPAPVLEIQDSVTLCNNDDPYMIQANTNRNLTKVNGPDWVTVENQTITITPNTNITAGTYSVSVMTMTDACEPLTETLTIIMNAVPVINTFAASQDTFCVGDQLTVTQDITMNAETDIYSAITAYHGNTVIDLTFPHTITLADTNLNLTLSASNPCGTVTSNIVINVSAPVELEITGVDTCHGLTIADFVPAPEYELYGATEVISEGWMVDLGDGEVEFAATDTLAAGDIAIVYYYVETKCDIYTSNEVMVEAFEDPDVYNDVEFKICDGQPIPQPTYGYNFEIYSGGAMILDTTWTIKHDGIDEEIDWDAPYDVTYDQDTITCTIETSCGSFPFEFILTVDTLPVPVLLQDTIICHDGQTTLSVTEEYVSYQWFMNGEQIEGATAQTYTVNAADLAAEDAFYTFTARVTDDNGCVSQTSVNGSYQAIDANEVTVQVTNSPRFIFKYQGVETHYIDGVETNDPNDPTVLNNNLVYTWEVYNPCFNEDTLVYVTFDIYHNDTLIDNNTIGNYLTNAAIPNSYNEFWNTSIEFSYQYGSAISHTTSSPLTRYNKAQAGVTNQYDNHFPYTKVYGSATFDDFYLHFLADNVYTQTIRPFRLPGEYKIIYRLYATSNTNTHGYPYYSESIDASQYANQSRIIGGWNSLVEGAIQTLLNIDSIMITVTGEDYSGATADNPAPAPMTPTYGDDATLNIYPNPTTDDINAEITGITGETTIQIVNLTGSVLSTDKVNIPATGKYLYLSSAKNLAPGVYFMYIINDSATLSKKLVVRR